MSMSVLGSLGPIASSKRRSAGSAPTPEILWWRFTEGAGNTIGAAVGPHGTAVGANWVNGPSGAAGRALQFAGNSTTLLSSASPINYASNIATFCCWLYWTAFSNNDALAFETTPNSNTNAHSLFVDPNASSPASGLWAMMMVGSTPPTVRRMESYARPAAAQWHHYAITFNGSTTLGEISMWINKALQSRTIVYNNRDTTNNFATNTLFCMSRNNASLHAAGRLAALRIYNRALSQAEINAIADSYE